MKKVFKLLFSIIVLLMVFTACQNKHIKEIDFNELKNMVNSKKTFALYVGNEECSHCMAYMPTLKEVLDEYDIYIYHLDNSKLSEDEHSDMLKYINISGTPTIAFFKKGEEESTLDRIVGETSKEETIEKFKLNGYIK